jgi:hypothetical protein
MNEIPWEKKFAFYRGITHAMCNHCEWMEIIDWIRRNKPYLVHDHKGINKNGFRHWPNQNYIRRIIVCYACDYEISDSEFKDKYYIDHEDTQNQIIRYYHPECNHDSREFHRFCNGCREWYIVDESAHICESFVFEYEEPFDIIGITEENVFTRQEQINIRCPFCHEVHYHKAFGLKVAHCRFGPRGRYNIISE